MTCLLRLVVMDMWKPFRNSTTRHAPQAAIPFDKFHVLRHLGEALDKVRKHEYARLDGKSRTFMQNIEFFLSETLSGTCLIIRRTLIE